MSYEERDPRKDPRPLDRVGNRVVQYVSMLGTVVYSRETSSTGRCSLETWRSWASGKEAKNSSSALSWELTVARELNCLRREYGAGEDELRRSLIDFALGILSQPYPVTVPGSAFGDVLAERKRRGYAVQDDPGAACGQDLRGPQ